MSTFGFKITTPILFNIGVKDPIKLVGLEAIIPNLVTIYVPSCKDLR
jgi:hypothetical protein